MTKSFKVTLLLTAFFWSLFLGGVYAYNWCDLEGAANLVLFTGPMALVGSVTSFIEWGVWRVDD
jgi:hypothetical protein